MVRLLHLAGSIAKRCLPQSVVRRLQRSPWYLHRHYCDRLAALDPTEEPDLQVARALVRAGELAIDVGANIGVYTRFLSREVGLEGRVWSLEPVPLTFSVLAHNVRALGFTNALPLPYAVTDVDHPVGMDVPLASSGHLDIYLARVTDEPASGATIRVTVQGRSLDSLRAELGGAPTFVKIDVEGHEAACIRGSRQLLAECRPALLIELGSDPDGPGTDARAILEELAQLGYECFWWDGRVVRRRRPGEKHVNHFFLQPAHQERLAAAGIEVERQTG